MKAKVDDLSIAILGPSGCGKSSIAYVIADALKAKGLNVKMVNVGERLTSDTYKTVASLANSQQTISIVEITPVGWEAQRKTLPVNEDEGGKQ